jgi:hypothetical protein
MIVWLWDSSGPDRAGRGVTDDEGLARRAAEACLRAGQATGARVELAHVVTGFSGLTSGYQRTGQGWTARQSAGRVTWVRLRAAS